MEARAKPFLDRIESVLDQLDSERGEYMAACRTLRDDIKEIYEEAKNAEVPKKALKGLVSWRILERKQEKLTADLEADEARVLENLIDALGPLGIAAAERAQAGKADRASRDEAGKDEGEKVGRGEEKEGDVRPGFLQRAEAEREAEAKKLQ